jgi:hypothetical protein
MDVATLRAEHLPHLAEARRIQANAQKAGIAIGLADAHAVYAHHRATRHWPFAFEPRFLAIYLPQVCDVAADAPPV